MSFYLLRVFNKLKKVSINDKYNNYVVTLLSMAVQREVMAVNVCLYLTESIFAAFRIKKNYNRGTPELRIFWVFPS